MIQKSAEGVGAAGAIVTDVASAKRPSSMAW